MKWYVFCSIIFYGINTHSHSDSDKRIVPESLPSSSSVDAHQKPLANILSLVAKGAWCVHHYFKNNNSYVANTPNLLPSEVVGVTGTSNACSISLPYYQSNSVGNVLYDALYQDYKKYGDNFSDHALSEQYHFRHTVLEQAQQQGLMYTEHYMPVNNIFYDMHAQGYPIAIHAYGVRVGNQIQQALVNECSIMVEHLALVHKEYGAGVVISLLFDLTNTAQVCTNLHKIGEAWAVLDVCWLMQKAVGHRGASLLSESFLSHGAPYFIAAVRSLCKGTPLEELLESVATDSQDAPDLFAQNWAIECARLCMVSGVLAGISLLVEDDECTVEDWLNLVATDDMFQQQCVRLIRLFLSS